MYNKGADIINIVLEDCTGRKIERFKANIQDREEIIRIFKYLNEKFDLGINITMIEQDNELKWFNSGEIKW